MRRTDWEAIERAYRAGKLSIREIAKNHDVSDTAIRKKATAGGWERDLSARVDEKVRVALVRNELRTANPQTEEELVDQAAEQVVIVVRSHRKRINLQTVLVDVLTQQLIDVAGRRHDFEEAIEEETADDENGKRRSAMLKAVALPTHASTAVNLANAMKTLVGLERQAFNIKDESDTTPNALADLIKQVSGNGLPVVQDEPAE
jgi:transposase-like protein